MEMFEIDSHEPFVQKSARPRPSAVIILLGGCTVAMIIAIVVLFISSFPTLE